MNFSRATADQLLKWAIVYLELQTDNLAACHLTPRALRIEPKSVADEVAMNRAWLKRARQVVK